jgi:hypothetical protein
MDEDVNPDDFRQWCSEHPQSCQQYFLYSANMIETIMIETNNQNQRRHLKAAKIRR